MYIGCDILCIIQVPFCKYTLRRGPLIGLRIVSGLWLERAHMSIHFDEYATARSQETTFCPFQLITERRKSEGAMRLMQYYGTNSLLNFFYWSPTSLLLIKEYNNNRTTMRDNTKRQGERKWLMAGAHCHDTVGLPQHKNPSRGSKERIDAEQVHSCQYCVQKAAKWRLTSIGPRCLRAERPEIRILRDHRRRTTLLLVSCD